MNQPKPMWKSRKVRIVVAVAVVDIVICFVPALAEVRTVLITALTALGGWLIGCIAGEDMSYWHGTAASKGK